jgi:capsular exopolysaccharide synthesis family protein
LLQLNTEYTNAQTDRVRREAAYKSVKGGTLEAAQVSTQGEALKNLTAKIEDAEEKFAQIKSHYGVNHPEYRKTAAQITQLKQQLSETRAGIMRRVEIEYFESVNREGMLRRAVAETKGEYDALNARSFEYQALKREADADKKLYEELVTKIKQEGINAAFQNSAIRLADPARPALKPVFPNMLLNLALAFVLSSMLAIAAAILSDAFDNTIRDAGQAHRLLNAEVVGSLPLVKGWKKLPVRAALVKSPKADQALMVFEDAVRTLRNSIVLGNLTRPLKSILVTSAGPREGKTTTAVHLAIVHAQMKHRTLLIDADLRNPQVASTLGLPEDAGLASVLSNGLRWPDKLMQLDNLPDLHILPAGRVSRESSDLLGPVLPRILQEAEPYYEFVVIDAPPFLGLPEPLQMATAVDGVVVVSVAGQTNRNAIASVLATLQRLRANIVGLVLNEVTPDLSETTAYGYYSKSYGKRSS